MKTFQLTFLVLFICSLWINHDTKTNLDRYFYPKKGVIINKYVMGQTKEGTDFHYIGKIPYMSKTVTNSIDYKFVIKYSDEIETIDVGEQSYNSADVGYIYTKRLEKNGWVILLQFVTTLIMMAYIINAIYHFQKFVWDYIEN